MKVYLDDVRPTPDGWVRTYTSQETIDILSKNDVEEISLDHDLDRCYDKLSLEELAKRPEIDTGMKVVLWLLENPQKLPKKWKCHSAREICRNKMTELLNTIDVKSLLDG